MGGRGVGSLTAVVIFNRKSKVKQLVMNGSSLLKETLLYDPTQ